MSDEPQTDGPEEVTGTSEEEASEGTSVESEE